MKSDRILMEWLNRTPHTVREFAWRPEAVVEKKTTEQANAENTPKTVPPGERPACVCGDQKGD